MWDCIKNLFRIGSKTSDDEPNTSGAVTTANTNILGKTQPVLILVPYGTHVKLPNLDVNMATWQQEANEEALVGMPFDIKNVDILTGNSGLAYGIPAEDERLIFKDTGIIAFKIGEVDTGDFLARFNELKAGFDQLKQDFNDFVTSVHNSDVVPHTHTFNYNAGVTPSNGTTNTAVIGTGTESTASIDNAKIDEIEVPPYTP